MTIKCIARARASDCFRFALLFSLFFSFVALLALRAERLATLSAILITFLEYSRWHRNMTSQSLASQRNKDYKLRHARLLQKAWLSLLGRIIIGHTPRPSP